MLDRPTSTPESKIVTLEPIVTKRIIGERSRRLGLKRWLGAKLNRLFFILCVLIPLPLIAFYLVFIASDTYEAEAQFAVRGSDTSSGGGGLLGFGFQLPNLSNNAYDSYGVVEYLQSKNLLNEVNKAVDVRKIYSDDKIDFLYRLAPTASNEDLERYWQWMTTVFYDTSKGVTTFKVRAFTPQDAVKIAQAALAQAEAVVNTISGRAREDSIRFSEGELTRTEKRLSEARQKLSVFRNTQGIVDAPADAAGRVTLIYGLEDQLAAAESSLSTLKMETPNSPNIRLLQNRIDQLKEQINAERLRLGALDKLKSGNDAPNADPQRANLYSEFEVLVTEREFAEKSYLSALDAMDKTRQDAAKQHKYLVTFVSPQLPELALYPQRIRLMLLATVVCLLLWSIMCLIGTLVRDHI